VFFGEGAGKTYVVLCHKEDGKIPISSVFSGAHAEKASPAEFRLLDCDHPLASGKTVAERFKLDMKQRPTIFLSGAVGPPQQIPSKHLKTSTMLSKLLRGKLEARTVKIETTQDLRSKCLDKDICALLLKGSKTSPSYLKDAVSKLIKEHPNVVFASVDATSLYVLNLEEHMVELKDEQPRFVVLKKVSGSLAADSSDRLITSMIALPTNGVGYGPMSNLVASVVKGSAQLSKLTSLPVIKTRTKKLEEQERAKRERKLEQQRRQQDKDSSQQQQRQSAFTVNDGSREGRKAERERRRAEHYKEHNVREKTPEEIAEMERKRRVRMAEEAAKWNMAPEDAPEEGERVVDGDVMEEMDIVQGSAAGGEGDEEDVLDLD
jgi:flagellar biosynthesis GTPase FlhF